MYYVHRAMYLLIGSDAMVLEPDGSHELTRCPKKIAKLWFVAIYVVHTTQTE